MEEALFEAIGQGNDGVHGAPTPDTCLVGIAEAKPRYPCIHIHSQPVCLTFLAPIVASIRQHPHFEQRDWLQFLIIAGKSVLLEKVVAGLLHHILERDKAGFILIQTLLQGGDGFLDGRTVFARWSFLRFGTNEAIRENRGDQQKRLFPFSLLTQQPPNDLTLASPLAIPMRQWASDVLPYLFPGGSGAFTAKLIEIRPQLGERLVDHLAAGIQETQCIGLGRVRQAHIVG